jgi:uncharacterized membrane protein YgcG
LYLNPPPPPPPSSLAKECGELFRRLTDPQRRADLANALQGINFRAQLTLVLDSINIPVPANNDVQTRVYSMTVQQLGDFDNYYEQNLGGFRGFIEVLLYWVEQTGGVFANRVSPENSPGRSGGGGGGNAGGGGDDGVAAV